jgi:hypothetical protein
MFFAPAIKELQNTHSIQGYSHFNWKINLPKSQSFSVIKSLVKSMLKPKNKHVFNTNLTLTALNLDEPIAECVGNLKHPALVEPTRQHDTQSIEYVFVGVEAHEAIPLPSILV